jgi:hypothetical protein
MTEQAHNDDRTETNIDSVESAIDWFIANADPKIEPSKVIKTLRFALSNNASALAYLDRLAPR